MLVADILSAIVTETTLYSDVGYSNRICVPGGFQDYSIKRRRT